MTLSVILAEEEIDEIPAEVFAANSQLLLYMIFDSPERQTYEIAEDEAHRIITRFLVYGGAYSVGQYSMRKGPAGFLARVNANFRNPTEEEIRADLMNHPEKIIGPEVKSASEKEKQEYSDSPQLKINGNTYYYKGLSRIVSTSILTQFFKGNLQGHDFEETIKKLDMITATSRINEFQLYQYFYSENGNLRYKGFTHEEKFDLDDLESLGQLKYKKRRLFLLKEGQEFICSC